MLWFQIASAVVVLDVGAAGDARASPGTLLSSAATPAPIGHWLVVLGVLLVPLLLYVRVRERLGILKTRLDLVTLAEGRPEFGWARVEADATLAIRAIYAAWNAGGLEEMARYMSPAFLESQRALLERWRAEGKRCVSELMKVRSLNPLWVHTKDSEHNARLSLLVRVAQLDYLEDMSSGRVLRGSRQPDRGFESVWHFELIDGTWRVYAIDGASRAFAFATLSNGVSIVSTSAATAALVRR